MRTSANNTNKRLIFLKFDYRKYSNILLLYKSTCHLLLKWTQGKAYSHWHLQLHTRLAERYRWRCADLHSNAIHALINTLGPPTRLIWKILGWCKYSYINYTTQTERFGTKLCNFKIRSNTHKEQPRVNRTYDPVFNLRFGRIWGCFCIIRGIKW